MSSITMNFTDDLNTDVQALIGLPYLQDGETPEGFDCFGLVRWLYAQRGIQLSARVREFRRAFVQAAPPYQPWDIALLVDDRNDMRHIGLVTDYPWVLQASIGTNGVARVSLLREPWQSWLIGIYRYDGDLP